MAIEQRRRILLEGTAQLSQEHYNRVVQLVPKMLFLSVLRSFKYSITA